MSNSEKKLQLKFRGDWIYVSGIVCTHVTTSYDVQEALSADYLELIQDWFPNIIFRSI